MTIINKGSKKRIMVNFEWMQSPKWLKVRKTPKPDLVFIPAGNPNAFMLGYRHENLSDASYQLFDKQLFNTVNGMALLAPLLSNSSSHTQRHLLYFIYLSPLSIWMYSPGRFLLSQSRCHCHVHKLHNDQILKYIRLILWINMDVRLQISFAVEYKDWINK